MPNIAPITIKGGEATPKDHTYVPSKLSDGVVNLVERVSSIPLGDPTLSWSLRGPGGNSENSKCTVKLTQPVLVTITDASGNTRSVVDHVPLGSADLVASNRSSKLQRADIRVRLANALLSGTVGNVWDDLEGGW